MRISISDLELYMKCPRAYQLHKIEGVEPQQKSLSLCKAITTRKVIEELYCDDKDLKDFSQKEIEEKCERVWKEEISVSKEILKRS